MNVAFIIGCILDEDKPLTVNGINDYFPMNVGNSWTYVYKTTATENIETFSIIESKQIDNKVYFIFDKKNPFIYYGSVVSQH